MDIDQLRKDLANRLADVEQALASYDDLVEEQRRLRLALAAIGPPASGVQTEADDVEGGDASTAAPDQESEDKL